VKVYFHHGQVIAFDDNGEQIPALQKFNLVTGFAAYAKRRGYDPTTFDIDMDGEL